MTRSASSPTPSSKPAKKAGKAAKNTGGRRKGPQAQPGGHLLPPAPSGQQCPEASPEVAMSRAHALFLECNGDVDVFKERLKEVIERAATDAGCGGDGECDAIQVLPHTTNPLLGGWRLRDISSTVCHASCSLHTPFPFPWTVGCTYRSDATVDSPSWMT